MQNQSNLKRQSDFLTINDIIDSTGLKESLVRRFLREVREIFDPYTKRGDNNSLLFDSNVYVIFDQIKQEHEKGVGFKDIKDSLLQNLKKTSQTTYQTSINTSQTTDRALFERINDLSEQKIRAEHAQQLAEKELEHFKDILKLLPAGGDPHKMTDIFKIIGELKVTTKPSWFWQNKHVSELWERLEQILRGNENL